MDKKQLRPAGKADLRPNCSKLWNKLLPSIFQSGNFFPSLYFAVRQFEASRHKLAGMFYQITFQNAQKTQLSSSMFASSSTFYFFFSPLLFPHMMAAAVFAALAVNRRHGKGNKWEAVLLTFCHTFKVVFLCLTSFVPTSPSLPPRALPPPAPPFVFLPSSLPPSTSLTEVFKKNSHLGNLTVFPRRPRPSPQPPVGFDPWRAGWRVSAKKTRDNLWVFHGRRFDGLNLYVFHACWCVSLCCVSSRFHFFVGVKARRRSFAFTKNNYFNTV